MNIAYLSQSEKNKAVRCLACNHKCLIPDGKRGICGVRENVCGDLRLLVYGKPCVVNVNPVEKKPLYHFLPGKTAFSIGTVGCNFKCGFCQNWQMSQNKEIVGQNLSPKKIKSMVTDPIVAYTYNEPSIFFEYAADIAQELPDLKHVLVTNGYFSKEALDKMTFIDAMNIDLKSSRPDFYQKNCGAKLQPVLDNIKAVYEKGIWLEITTLLIPEENDSLVELREIARFIAKISPDIPWHISAFHPDFQMVNRRNTTFQDLVKAYNVGKEAGLNYVYLGNINNNEYNSTFCPKCKKLLIKRVGYSVSVEGLINGQCKFCGQEIKGVWK